MKTVINDALYDYAIAYGVREHEVLKQLSAYNKTLANGQMQTAPEQAQLMAMIAKIMGARKYLEVGVFTGYSTLAMALAMGYNAQIVAIDNNIKHIEIATQFWQQAQVAQQISVHLGEAKEMLEQLSTSENLASFDIAFIDANKNDYLAYFHLCYNLVRTGGIIIVDNVLMHGLILEDNPPKYAQAIKEFNETLYKDERFDLVMLPLADGVTIVYKK